MCLLPMDKNWVGDGVFTASSGSGGTTVTTEDLFKDLPFELVTECSTVLTRQDFLKVVLSITITYLVSSWVQFSRKRNSEWISVRLRGGFL